MTPVLDHPYPVTQAAFSPDGRHLLTVSGGSPRVAYGSLNTFHQFEFSMDIEVDSAVRLWDVATGKPAGAPLRHGAGVRSAAFSPDGRYVVTAAVDGTARVWDVGTATPTGVPLHAGNEDAWERLRAVRHVPQPASGPLHHRDEVVQAVFSADGRQVVAATRLEVRAWLWDVTAAKPSPERLPDGEKLLALGPGPGLVTAGKDAAVRVRGAATLRPLGPPLRHTSPVTDVSWTRDGRRLLTCCEDNTVHVWQVADGQAVSSFRPRFRLERRLGQVDLTPGGRRVIAGDLGGFFIQLWDADTGTALAPSGSVDWDDLESVFRENGETGAFAYGPFDHYACGSADDRQVAVVSTQMARVWDAETGVLRAVLRPPAPAPRGLGALLGLTQQRLVSSAVRLADFNPDGTRLVVAFGETAGVWDPASGRPLTPPLEHRKPITLVAYSPDGSRLLTVSEDQTARVWQAATGLPLTPPLEHRGPVTLAKFSPDGRYLLTASKEGPGPVSFLEEVLRLWDARTGEPVTPPLSPHKHLTGRHSTGGAEFSADGRRLFLAAEDHLEVWDLSPLPQPLEDLAVLSQVAACRRIDAIGTLVPLEPETAEAWQALRARSPAEFTSSREEVLAWHWDQALSCERSHEWSAAAWHLGRLAEARAGDADFYRHRARNAAELGRWDDALADYARSVELQHRALYEQALAQPGDATDARAALDTCLLSTSPAAETARLREVAGKRADDQPKDAGWHATLGAAAYRENKQPDTAARDLEEALRLAGALEGAHTAGDTRAALFLAMAQHCRGNKDEADRRLKQAVQWLEAPAPLANDQNTAEGRPAWEEWLQLLLLRREAEKLIHGNAPPPGKGEGRDQ
jgi:WD40 repeat protein